MFSVRPLWKKGRRRRFFFFFSFQNGRRTHFPKQPAGLFFQDGCQFFCFNGPHLDSGYDISLFRAGFGKRLYFLCFFNLTDLKKKDKKKEKQAASKKEAGGDAKHVCFFTSPYAKDPRTTCKRKFTCMQ